MKALTVLLFWLLAAVAWGQTTPTPKKITDYPDLGAPIDSTDWLLMHDTSANAYKRIGPANLLASKQDTSGNLTSLAALVDPNGNRMLIWNDATNEFDYQAIPVGGSLSLTGVRIPYGDGAGGSTHEAGFEYDAVNNLFKVGYGVEIGGGVDGVVLYKSGADELTLFGSGNGNELVLDFSVEDELRIGSLTPGFDRIFLDGIDLEVPADAYGAGWALSPEVPRKMDIYAKIESLAPSGGDVTAAAAFGADNRLIRSDGTGKGVQVTGITVDDSNNITGVGNMTVTQLMTSILQATTFGLVDTNASHYLNLKSGSDLTANRDLNFITGDATRTVTVNGNPTLNDWFDQSVKAAATPTFAAVTVDAEAYGAGWSGDPTVARKSDIYTKIETLGGSSGPSIDSFRQNPFFWEDFLLGGTPASGAFVGDFNFTKSTSGSGATTSNDVGQTNAPGIATATSGTTTTGYSFFNTYSSAYFFGGASYTLEGRFYIPVLRDGTEDYSFVFGFHDITTAAATDGCYFLYDNASANWQIVNRSNATGTATASAVAVAATTWVRLRVVVNAAANSVSYFVDGTELAVSPLTTNIPTAVNRQTGIRWGIVKSAGTTAREIWCDYVGLQIGLSAAR